MAQDEWLLATLDELRRVARQERLPKLEAELRTLSHLAALELAARDDAGRPPLH